MNSSPVATAIPQTKPSRLSAAAPFRVRHIGFALWVQATPKEESMQLGRELATGFVEDEVLADTAPEPAPVADDAVIAEVPAIPAPEPGLERATAG
jgi:hypothetical protein